MNLEEMFKKYADLVIKCALNIKEGDFLLIRTPIEVADLANIMAQTAYEEGAFKVQIDYRDENFTRIKYLYESKDILTDIPEFLVDKEKYFLDKKTKYLSITGGDPEILKGIDPEKISAYNRASGQAYKEFNEKLMANYTSWCVIGGATKAWAKKVFPNLDTDKAVLKLWEEIFYTIRLFDKNPIESMNEHIKALDKYAKFLTPIL